MTRPSWVPAARALIGPGLVLQAMAAGVVLLYYFSPLCREALQHLVDLRDQWGWRYSAVSTAVFGGVIPFTYLRLRRETRSANPLSHAGFHLVFWAYKGLEVDALYHLQAFMFGRDPAVSVVIRKVLFDEFAYTPLWAVPSLLVAYRWKDVGFSPAAFARTDWKAHFRATYPAGLFSSWVVWIPAVAAVYSLPFPLQIPLFNLELCFWTLLFATLTHRPKTPAPAA